MIESLKSDDLVQKAGGRFRLTALIQRRWSQLMEGSRPLVERQGRTDLELVVQEIAEGKITSAMVEELEAEAAAEAAAAAEEDTL